MRVRNILNFIFCFVSLLCCTFFISCSPEQPPTTDIEIEDITINYVSNDRSHKYNFHQITHEEVHTYMYAFILDAINISHEIDYTLYESNFKVLATNKENITTEVPCELHEYDNNNFYSETYNLGLQIAHDNHKMFRLIINVEYIKDTTHNTIPSLLTLYFNNHKIHSFTPLS